MTTFAADLAQLIAWGEGIEKELDLTQSLAADPHLHRKFRALGMDEFISITGASIHEWKTLTRDLKEAGDLITEGNRSRVTLAQMHAWMDAKGRRPRRPEGINRAMRLAVSNFKGGACKSSGALHIGTRLAMDGYRVLFLDLDGQATLSRYLGFQPYRIKPEHTFAASIGLREEDGETVNGEPLPLRPVRTFIDGADAVPASMEITSIDMEMLGQVADGTTGNIFKQFANALDAIDNEYDVVLMDFQPSFNLSQLLIMFLADGMILPIPTETADFAGTGDFLSIAGKWLGQMSKLYGGQKVYDPVLAVHLRSKMSMHTEKNLSPEAQQEAANLLKAANSVYASSGRVFGLNRPFQVIEDRQVVSRCLGNLKSVYEADSSDYDIRAIKHARSQYDALTDQILSAVKLRWAEMLQEQGSATSKETINE